jgi:hypothetical protein
MSLFERHQAAVWDALTALLEFTYTESVQSSQRRRVQAPFDADSFAELMQEMSDLAVFATATEILTDNDLWRSEYTLGNEILFAPEMFFTSRQSQASFEDVFGVAKARFAPRARQR